MRLPCDRALKRADSPNDWVEEEACGGAARVANACERELAD